MPVVSKEEIANARKMDLLSYLRAYEPGELVRFSGETYCTRTHDSLKISNGKWYWFSQNIGGRSALDYLVKVKEMSFPEAVKMLNGQAVQPICYEKPPPAPRKLLLPLLDTNTSKTEAYLKSRGIHPQIIAYCIQHGLLFQSENANDVIFVGYDTKGTRRYAALRSMTTDYKGEATGSDKHFSFALVADDRPVREVHVFEAAIDAMSYASLKIMYHKDWRKIAYLSLAGVFASKRANVVPVALEQFLKDHSQITKVVLHLDNDRVGRQAAESIMGGLDKKYTVLNRPPRAGKDVNDYLRMEIRNRNDDRVAYLGLSQLDKFQESSKVNSEIYDKVFEGAVEVDTLEGVYQMFNCDCPEDFQGHSLSVSDVVEIVNGENAGFYFCDSIGFQPVKFEPEQTQKLDTRTMRVVLVEPGKAARVAEIDGSLEGMQKTVSGYIQAVYPFEETVCLVCNEEGKLQGLPLNRALRDEDNRIYDIVAGTFFVCDCSTENFKSLSEEQLKRYTEKYKRPERFVQIDDQILAIPMPVKSDKERER